MTPLLALQADLLTLKAHLKMAYVMEHYGHSPELQDTSGKLHYISPFRDDATPSFDIFSHLIKGRTEPEERFGDYADPNLAQGDVVDLVGLFEACSPTMAQDKARTLLAEQVESNWAGPTVEAGQYKVLDLDEVARYVENARPLSASETWMRLPRTHPGLMDVVLPSDRVFMHPEFDIVVFLLLDDDGEVRGVRHRNDEGAKYGLTGGTNILMRLEPSSDKPVFLAEGETDLWATWGALHDEYEVLGVPGVGTTPRLAGADALAGRQVFISFDPDSAGNDGRSVWAEYLSSIGCSVHTIVLPDGKDIAQLHPEQIRRLPERARSLPEPPPDFGREGAQFGIYNWVGKGDERTAVFVPKSNWAFEPEKILIYDDGTRAYQGVLSPSRRTVVLPDSAVTSSAQLKRWGAKYQARWFGSDAQVQLLAALLDHEAAYLPEGRIHNQVGLYEGTFAWPDNYIGDQPVEHVPTVAQMEFGTDKIFLEPVPVNPVKVFEALLNAQHEAVTGPMLAWLAAAPLRTRFNQKSGSAQFPYLSVTGVSGSGKSALTDRFLRAFSSTNLASTLSSTTPYAVQTLMDNSCGFPIWFDEYRPGAKMETKTMLDQLLREAYTMQVATKGGQDRDNLSKLTSIRTAAPVVVSGEDNFSEESHVERLVAVRLVQPEQGPLPAVQDVDYTGFGYTYLTYLTEPEPGVPDAVAPVYQTPVLSTPSGFDVKDRPERNLRVLQFGWQLLAGFLNRFDPTYEMPELDLSRVVGQYQESARSNPVMDLVKVCLENDTLHDTVWRYAYGSDDWLCISPQNLIDESRNHPSITLPVSSADGLRKLLQDKYGVSGTKNTPVPNTHEPKRLKAIRIPWDEVDFGDDDGEGDE